MSLGKKLYDLRTSKDLKQEQVAYDLEIVQVLIVIGKIMFPLLKEKIWLN